jgi:tetratricopeptide (TPR) repeat protein
MQSPDNFDVFVTITGLNKFPNCRRLFEGETLILKHEPDNEFDQSAVSVYGNSGKIGYVANGNRTVRDGTFSAAQLLLIMDKPQLAAEVVEGTYTDAVCRVPGLFDVDKVTLKAFEYYNCGEYENALKLFLKLCEKYNSLLLLQNTADCFIKLERYEEALRFVKAALEIEYDNKSSLMMHATTLENLEKYSEAINEYKKILKNKENAQVRQALNNCIKKASKRGINVETL